MNPPAAQMNELAKHFRAGNLQYVAAHGRELQKQYPKSALLLNVLGATYLGLEMYPAAQEVFERAIKVQPKNEKLHLNLGIALVRQNQIKRGISALIKATKIKPSYARAHLMTGNAYQQDGDTRKALHSYRKAIKFDDNQIEAHFNIGLLLGGKEQFLEAKGHFERVLQVQGNHALAAFWLAKAHQKLGQKDEALYWYEHALKCDPDHLQSNMESALLLLEFYELNRAASRFTKVLELEPKSVIAQHNLGFIFYKKKQVDQAIECFRKAIEIDPDFVNSYMNAAEVYILKREFDLALKEYEKVLDRFPDLSVVQSRKLSVLSSMLDWDGIDALLSDHQLTDLVSGGLTPLHAYYFTDDPVLQLGRARSYCDEKFPQQTDRKAPSDKPDRQADRVRIGYISTNFQEHPVMDLTTGLFREHDLSKFEIHAIAFGAPLKPETKAFFESHSVHVHDIKNAPDASFVSYVQSLGLDIAIDMTGHTGDTRTRLFAHGLAPVQVNYLAYPGTLGSEAFDYIVADETVIGTDQTDHYVEHVMWLPDSFMPCDNQRVISETVKHRAEYGLPEEGFVFCSFNNPVKISPREFDIWMRLLGEIEGSCLWLTGKNKWVPENLRKQAERRGIDPDRLVFTERVPMEEHLARHAHADLFLDTFNYNAHTTANEALWSGLPLVTKIGDQFAARVAASLLRAVGLPELVTQSEAEYEALALALARDPERLSALRTKLQANRLSTALFDTQTYVRNFEAGLAEAHRRRIAGEAVSNIVVSDL